jgi:hypothetical protein
MRLHYNVAPRYTPGSPASVSEDIALTVASQEKEHYEVALSGIYGEDFKKIALERGLDGIVERRVERNGGWDVEDMVTGRKLRRVEVAAKDLRLNDQILDIKTGLEAEKWNGSGVFPVAVLKLDIAGSEVIVRWDPIVPVPFVFKKNDRVKIERLAKEEL